MNKDSKLRQFILFGFVGTFCTILHYALYYVLQRVMNVNVAYTAGYLLSFIANFYLTSFVTFSTKPTWRKLCGLGGAHIVNYLIHIGLLNFFLWAGIKNEWAPLPVFAIAIPVNFILVRWVFTSKNRTV